MSLIFKPPTTSLSINLSFFLKIANPFAIFKTLPTVSRPQFNPCTPLYKIIIIILRFTLNKWSSKAQNPKTKGIIMKMKQKLLLPIAIALISLAGSSLCSAYQQLGDLPRYSEAKKKEAARGATGSVSFNHHKYLREAIASVNDLPGYSEEMKSNKEMLLKFMDEVNRYVWYKGWFVYGVNKADELKRGTNLRNYIQLLRSRLEANSDESPDGQFHKRYFQDVYIKVIETPSTWASELLDSGSSA